MVTFHCLSRRRSKGPSPSCLSAFFSEWTATEKELRENPTGKVIYYQDAEPNPSLRGKQNHQESFCRFSKLDCLEVISDEKYLEGFYHRICILLFSLLYSWVTELYTAFASSDDPRSRNFLTNSENARKLPQRGARSHDPSR